MFDDLKNSISLFDQDRPLNHLAKVEIYEDYDACYHNLCQFRHFAVTTKASKHYHEFEYEAGDVFIFGPETRGLPANRLNDQRNFANIRVPMVKNNRSMNLSNAVAVILFEAWRQNKFIKGEYYSYQGKERLGHLIYPLPTENSLGLHATLDLGKGIRFGPSAYLTTDIHYSLDKTKKDLFLKTLYVSTILVHNCSLWNSTVTASI